MDTNIHSLDYQLHICTLKTWEQFTIATKKGKKVILMERVTEHEAFRNLMRLEEHVAFEFRMADRFDISWAVDIQAIRERQRIDAIAQKLDGKGRANGHKWNERTQKLQYIKKTYECDVIANEMNFLRTFDFKVTPEMVKAAQQLARQRRGAA